MKNIKNPKPEDMMDKHPPLKCAELFFFFLKSYR